MMCMYAHMLGWVRVWLVSSHKGTKHTLHVFVRHDINRPFAIDWALSTKGTLTDKRTQCQTTASVVLTPYLFDSIILGPDS